MILMAYKEGNMIRMVTAIPKALVSTCERHDTIYHNTLIQLNDAVINTVRSFMTENTGYDSYTVACLSRIHGKNATLATAAEDLDNYFPVKAEDSILFELTMSDDAVISIEYDKMLKCSNEFDLTTDAQDASYVAEELRSALTIGRSNADDVIAFIPGLSLDKCKYFAVLDKNFNTEHYELQGIKQIDLKDLSTFK